MIRRKYTYCKRCKRKTYIYSRGYCKGCYWINLREEKKKKKKIKISDYKKKLTGEKIIFEVVWKKQNGRCFITDKYISYEDARAINFVHILSKAKNKYPNFKFYDKNIVLAVARFHQLYDHGTKDKLYEEFGKYNDKLNKFFRLKKELLRDYV